MILLLFWAMDISSDVFAFFENFLAGRRFISTEAMSQVERVSDLQQKINALLDNT